MDENMDEKEYEVVKEVTTLFDRLYSATKETIKAAKKPTVRKRIKRKLNSAHDDAEEQIIDLEAEVDGLRRNFDKYDVNKIVDNQSKIKKLKLIQKLIESEHYNLFNERIV